GLPLSSVPAGGATTAGKPRARRRLRGDLFTVLGWPLTIALLVLILYPIGTMLWRTFVPGGNLDLSPFRDLIHDPTFVTSCKNTLIIAAIAGPAAVAIGTLFAWLNERPDSSFGAVSRLAPLIPLLIPPVCLAVGWIFVAQPTVGFLNYYLREGL